MRLKEKNNDQTIKALLKEYVALKTKRILIEDAGGDDYYNDSNYGMWTTGSTAKNQEFLLTIFGLRGLYNVGRVALGGVEAIITRIFGELGIVLESLVHTLSPLYWAESSEDLAALVRRRRSDLESRIGRIRGGYADAMAEAERSIASASPDIAFFSFLANPASFIGLSAARGAVPVGYNVYHRIRYGGPPGTRTTGARSATDTALSTETSGLISRAGSIDSSSGRSPSDSDSATRAIARTILGDSATEEDINNLISGARLNEAVGAVAAPASNSLPNSTVNPYDRQFRQLQLQANQLNQKYIDFLNSPEVRTVILQNPAVKEGQKAIVDLVVNNYRGVISNLTFERMRSEHPREFEQAENAAREEMRKNSQDQETETSETTSTETTPASEPTETGSVLFDTEEKRNTFVSIMKRQMSLLPISQLRSLAQQTPELRTAVEAGIRQIQSLVSGR